MIDQLLARHRLRATPVRRAVLAQLLARGGAAVSPGELGPDDVDRITRYRTLRALEEHGLIHRVVDEHGGVKYALCGATCTPVAHHDTHPHFECDDCAETYCLPGVASPAPELPAGYRLTEARLTLRGRCPACAANASA